jgi:hypothetical protein
MHRFRGEKEAKKDLKLEFPCTNGPAKCPVCSGWKSNAAVADKWVDPDHGLPPPPVGPPPVGAPGPPPPPHPHALVLYQPSTTAGVAAPRAEAPVHPAPPHGHPAEDDAPLVDPGPPRVLADYGIEVGGFERWLQRHCSTAPYQELVNVLVLVANELQSRGTQPTRETYY